MASMHVLHLSCRKVWKPKYKEGIDSSQRNREMLASIYKTLLIQTTWKLIPRCHNINCTDEYNVDLTTDRQQCFVLELILTVIRLEVRNLDRLITADLFKKSQIYDYRDLFFKESSKSMKWYEMLYFVTSNLWYYPQDTGVWKWHMTYIANRGPVGFDAGGTFVMVHFARGRMWLYSWKCTEDTFIVEDNSFILHRARWNAFPLLLSWLLGDVVA